MQLEHIGIAVAELEKTEALIKKLTGREAYKREDVPGQNVKVSFVEGGGEVKLELLTPTKEEGPVHKFVDKRGPGLHHIAFAVDDIAAEMRRLEDDGFELLSELPLEGADNKLVCFLHPRSTGGILVEICQHQ